MHFKFNNFTGRLIGNTYWQPLNPISPEQLHKNDSKITFESKNVKLSTVTKPTYDIAKPRMIPGTNIPYGEIPESIRRNQARFQQVDGLPVFLKGGAFDKILFGATIGLCILGVGLTFRMIYTMSFPQKKK